MGKKKRPWPPENEYDRAARRSAEQSIDEEFKEYLEKIPDPEQRSARREALVKQREAKIQELLDSHSR
jgi:hypothetical protein